MAIVVNMATWQAWQSKAMGVATERERQKFWGRGCLVYGLILGGCRLYSLSGSEEEKGGFMGGGLHMYFGGPSGARRHSTKRQSEALLPNNYTLCTFLRLCCRQPIVSRWELLPFPRSSSSISPHVNSSKQFISPAWVVASYFGLRLLICLLLLLVLAFVSFQFAPSALSTNICSAPTACRCLISICSICFYPDLIVRLLGTRVYCFSPNLE